VPDLVNLAVDLDEPFAQPYPSGVEIQKDARADEQTLAWIDELFGGSWSSEAYVGSALVARRSGAPIGFAAFDARDFAWLQGLAREPDVGIFGPFGLAVAESTLGVALLRNALDALRERGYRRALIPAVADDRLVRYYAGAAGARVAERFDRAGLYRPARRTLVMASGNGSNFQAVLDASRDGTLPLEIAALLSNDPRAYAVGRARSAGLDSIRVVAWNRAEETREQYDARLLEAARATRPDLVLLLGWMHLLAESFVRAFADIVNLHPAFLPLEPARDTVVMPDGARIAAFRGPHAVRDALAGSSPWVGATLHRVTAATDRGPVLARKPLRIESMEEESHLMERVHELERGVVRTGVTRWLFER
jgi:phosphoribosylglycinamide formyltransferase 1